MNQLNLKFSSLFPTEMFGFFKDVKFSLKALINKQKTKVLFAEIDSDLADVLFSFLTLPLGKIVRILKKHYGDKALVFGSITTLYDGLSNLESSHFWTEGGKQMLLDPTSSFIDECRRLKLDIGDNQPIKYYTCENLNCSYHRTSNLGMYYDTVRCDCGKQLKKEIPVRNVPKADDGEVFTIKTATFLISDDLQILPNVTASIKQIISDLGHMDIDGTELRNVSIGFNEIMDLLKHSLLSPTPLSNLVLNKQISYKPGTSFNRIWNKATINYITTLKVILQKSTKKFLFAEAEDDFVEFISSFLIISLGGVEHLLGANTSLKNIDNLYRSAAFPIDGKYLSQGRYRLIWPNIPYGYLSKNGLFSLTEEGAPKLCYCKASSTNEEYLYCSKKLICDIKCPRGQFNYIKGPRKYMVKDDLTVTPLCLTSYINTLNEQKISLSDVDELELKIGSQEASSILKASLSSTFALSMGLNHLIMKQPKQEK
ncbi:hypothetical protein CASFOL_020040 [Castilleja foliolosa]|uniref:Uncharacterized protein n=1 Tax=Castilleja foliolosa TaxID=1961234 RepID=A0ABD3D0H4_9LAMI